MVRLRKATQALIEVPHLRFQSAQKDTIIAQKNKTIEIMGQSVRVLHASNQELRGIIDLNKDKWKDCDTYSGKLEDRNKQLKAKNGFIQIGTPVILVAVGTACTIAGYYIRKAIE